MAAVVGGAWEWLDGFRGWCAGDEGSFSENWLFIYGDKLCGNQSVRRVHPIIFTKSFFGDDAAVLAPSSGDGPAAPRHRAGVVSMAWRSTRRFSMKAP